MLKVKEVGRKREGSGVWGERGREGEGGRGGGRER